MPEPRAFVEAAVEPPKPPKGLGAPGRAAWKKIWGAGRRWLSPESDVELVRKYAAATDEWERLQAWLAEGGVERRWYTTANGQIATHPAVKQLRELDAQMTSWLSLLGLTPTDRSRLGLAEVKAASELDKFRKRRASRPVEPVASDVVDAVEVAGG